MNIITNFLLMIFIVFFNNNIWGQKVFTVCKTNCDFKEIQQSIDAAPSYSTIIIKDDYKINEEIKINKPLTLTGSKDYKPLIDGNHLKHVIYVTNTKDIEIYNLKISNSGYSDIDDYAGIYIEYSQNCKIIDNELINNTYGIYLAYVQNCQIEKNLIHSNAKSEVQSGNGIHLWYSYTNFLKNNQIYGHRDGLYFEYSQDLVVENNTSFNNIRYGIHFMFCHGSKIINNRFFLNQSGIALMYSKNLDLSYNTIQKTWGNSVKSLLLKDIDRSIISHNIFMNNTTAIYMDNSNNNEIFNNDFKKNGLSLEIYGNSWNNKIYHNLFENNMFDVATNSFENPNEYYENFWDKYKGYDLNKDGLGDVPYKPVSLFSFWVSRYPTLSILIRSPMVDFLELLEKVFPVLTPAKLIDTKPLMKRKGILND